MPECLATFEKSASCGYPPSCPPISPLCHFPILNQNWKKTLLKHTTILHIVMGTPQDQARAAQHYKIAAEWRNRGAFQFRLLL